MPAVSIIVPFFNAERYLESCVKSVLSQSIADWELLLINDGSTDRSAEIAQRFIGEDKRIHLYEHAGGENRGVSLSRQLGIDHAKGEFVAFLDADDLYLPEKLEQQIDVANRSSRIGVFHTAVETINEDGDLIASINAFNDFSSSDRNYAFGSEPKFLESHSVCNSSTLIRKSCLDGMRIGYSQLFQSEDFVLWVRLSERARFFFDACPMVCYREHPTSATLGMTDNRAAIDLRHIEFLVAVIATAQNEATIERARHLLEGRWLEMSDRIRAETNLDHTNHHFDLESIYSRRVAGVVRRLSRAVNVLRYGG